VSASNATASALTPIDKRNPFMTLPSLPPICPGVAFDGMTFEI